MKLETLRMYYLSLDADERQMLSSILYHNIGSSTSKEILSDLRTQLVIPLTPEQAYLLRAMVQNPYWPHEAPSLRAFRKSLFAILPQES
jgi:hypothetical protein